MREYLSSLLLLSAVLAVGSLLAYRENDKIFRFAFSLIFCAAVVLPIRDNVGALSFKLFEGSDIELEKNNEYETLAEETLSSAYTAFFCDGLGIPEDNVRLDFDGFELEKMRFSSVVITLYGSSVFSDISAVERFAKESFGGCDVKIRLG